MYKEGVYSDLSKKEIKKKVKEKGFDPIIIYDVAGRVYPEHTHPETKLLAILEGSMNAKVSGKEYVLTKGDELIIKGNIVHSAIVGDVGCEFFWSEVII